MAGWRGWAADGGYIVMLPKSMCKRQDMNCGVLANPIRSLVQHTFMGLEDM